MTSDLQERWAILLFHWESWLGFGMTINPEKRREEHLKTFAKPQYRGKNMSKSHEAILQHTKHS